MLCFTHPHVVERVCLQENEGTVAGWLSDCSKYIQFGVSKHIRERKCREKQRDWFSHSNMTFAEKFPMKEREISLEAV